MIHEWINTTILQMQNFTPIVKRPQLPPLSAALCNCSDGEQSCTVDGVYFRARAVPSLLWSDSNLMFRFALHTKQLKLLTENQINSTHQSHRAKLTPCHAVLSASCFQHKINANSKF